MMRIDFLATDKAALKAELQRHQLPVADAKSIADMQTLIVAFGGGIGVAAIIKAVGDSLKNYLDARSANDKVIIKFGRTSIEANSANIAAVLAQLTERMQPPTAS